MNRLIGILPRQGRVCSDQQQRILDLQEIADVGDNLGLSRQVEFLSGLRLIALSKDVVVHAVVDRKQLLRFHARLSESFRNVLAPRDDTADGIGGAHNQFPPKPVLEILMSVCPLRDANHRTLKAPSQSGNAANIRVEPGAKDHIEREIILHPMKGRLGPGGQQPMIHAAAHLRDVGHRAIHRFENLIFRAGFQAIEVPPDERHAWPQSHHPHLGLLCHITQQRRVDPTADRIRGVGKEIGNEQDLHNPGLFSSLYR